MSYTGIEPEGVRVLADQLAASADLAEGLALDVDRALFESGLESSTPSVLRGFANGLVHTGTVLRNRADLAHGFVLDFALHDALLGVAKSVAIAAPACVVGPSTTLGSNSPCDPVESIKVYSLAAGAYIPFTAVAGVKLDASYVLRVESLHSGRLRVTRIDEADVGIATSLGMTGELNVGPLTTASGAGAQAWLQVLMAQGATYEIAQSELDEFIAFDLLDHLEGRLALPGGVAGFGFAKAVAKKFVGLVDHLPMWKLHNLVSDLRKRLNWNRPAPLSTFTEVGLTGGSNASTALPFLGQIPVKGKVGLSISGRTVVGVEHRDDETTYYLDLRAEIGTPIAARIFGFDLSKLRGAQMKIGVVVDEKTGAYDRIEFTVVNDTGKTADRHAAVVDLTDPATHPAADRLIADIADPTAIGDVLAALESLLGHRVTTDQTTFRKGQASTYGVNVLGNGFRFHVETLDVH